MSQQHQPPFSITPALVTLIGETGEALGRLAAFENQARPLRLRRVNRIRTIGGALGIDGNGLDEAQITAILDGKQVIAPPREIQEVRNALAAYERFGLWKPEAEQDLLEAHRILMSGLVEEVGQYRSGDVGVVEGSRVIHVAPPAQRVPALMDSLFHWLAASDAHPCIVSSVFHYEFEFIHPFADGNGRMGRLWQSLILSRWKPVLADLPVESLIFEHQGAYYYQEQQVKKFLGLCAMHSA